MVQNKAPIVHPFWFELDKNILLKFFCKYDNDIYKIINDHLHGDKSLIKELKIE